MRKILGLDLGTNSIGWSVVKAESNKDGKEVLCGIEAAGSRIIPMDASVLADFDKGVSKSQTAERTRLRGIRRLYERSILRRERLHRVLDLLGFLPTHYAESLTRYGKFKQPDGCKLAWKKNDDGSYEFIFQESFDEMVAEFRTHHPELLQNGKKIPYDWTIYYLRTKALKEKIKKEELAWILLNFNQKRGYHQLREEEEENSNKRMEYYALKVINVEDSGEKKGKDTIYKVYLENGMIYQRVSKTPLDWIGKTKEFIVTTELNPDGTEKRNKEGEIKRSFRQPNENDWNLVKIRTEENIAKSHYTIGEYIYRSLLDNPKQKIRGRLVRTVERKFYKDELKQILETQVKFHAELQDSELYKACLQELYPSNESHRNNISARNFVYLFLEDILFYQRPLKSKKSQIDNCPYEEHSYVDKSTGEIIPVPIKCIAKSNPLFQEFRLWQFIKNLRIYKRDAFVNGKPISNLDVTQEFLPDEDAYVNLFKWINEKETIKQNELLTAPCIGVSKKESDKYRWNFVEDKTYPGNETRSKILKYLIKAGIKENFLTPEKEEALWHILYSVEDKTEIRSALEHFATRYELPSTFVDIFCKFPPFEKEYGSYSAKAIKKLLSLMRMGEYWNPDNICAEVKLQINEFIKGNIDEKLIKRISEKMQLTDISQCHGLPLWIACYLIYGRHSEAKETEKWSSPKDIDIYLKTFKQHSLRNPIVEQIILETLRTVRDIWKQVGQIDEIHIELGREMKNPADKRARITRQVLENENTNLRIKALLSEFINPEFQIENVRPYSASQQEILRIYEEDILRCNEIPEDLEPIFKKLSETEANKRPSKSDVLRYKCWLEQKYRSPYTGEPIPLGKLFTPAYEIEHIIPQSRYFDDSLSNKVICEAEVNKLKDKMLGYEFISQKHGTIVPISFGKPIRIFEVEEYLTFVNEHYSSNPVKKAKLLMSDIPEQFIARQLNDSRYISKKIKTLLSNIVREENEMEETSKNVISCTGGITDRLKNDWGINDVWNKIILPRFIRLNEIKKCNLFTSTTENGHLIPSLPLEFQKGFSKKRIDHRHHAMDAIIIACASRNIVNYLNNESACAGASISRGDLKKLLCTDPKTRRESKYINKPWDTFTTDVYDVLSNIIVSFKQNLRIINKTSNRYLHYEDGKKVRYTQNKGNLLSIRKPMHKETYYGEINLRLTKTVTLTKALECIENIANKDLRKKLRDLLQMGYNEKTIKKYFKENKDTWSDVNLSKIRIYYFSKESSERFFASRKPLDESFTKDKIKDEIADTAIQKILLRHLENKDGDPSIAFSPDGIDEMNANIVSLNDGVFHQPIYKVRIYEKSSKYAVGQKGNKATKFVEAAKGTNLFYAVYEKTETTESGSTVFERTCTTLPLNECIDRKKKGLPITIPNESGEMPKFILSPNDLVYVPTSEEIKNRQIKHPINRDRIYKLVSVDKKRSFFIPSNVASCIINKDEYTTSNKIERAVSGEIIREICLPVKTDRLGNIVNDITF